MKLKKFRKQDCPIYVITTPMLLEDAEKFARNTKEFTPAIKEDCASRKKDRYTVVRPLVDAEIVKPTERLWRIKRGKRLRRYRDGA